MSNIAFEMPKNKSNSIKVIGVGGGGSNAVDYMYQQDIKGVDFVICNTDAQALESSPIPNKIQLGTRLTEGMGAGANPKIGADAAKESYDELSDLLQTNTKMVFITAGMGGGTGTGAAPIIAGIAKELGLLTVGIVTMPFEFEGKKRSEAAQKGITALRENVDSLIVINNNKLGEVYGDMGYKSGFAKADEVLSTAARGIAEVITHHYKQNIDLNDAKTVLSNSGTAIMGSATASGEDRALKAIRDALDSPLLNDNKITGAKNVLLLIISGTREITLNEIGIINQYIRTEAGYDVNIILGIGDDESIGEAVGVTVIATGFSSEQQHTISEVEVEKIIHALEDNQPIQYDLFSSKSNENPVRPLNDKPEAKQEDNVIFSLGDEKIQEKLTATSDYIKDLEVTHEELLISEDEEFTFVVEDEVMSEDNLDKIIMTTEAISNIEVTYDEIIAEILKEKPINTNVELSEVEEEVNETQTTLSFDFPVDQDVQKAVRHNLEDFKEKEEKREIVAKNEKVVVDENLQLELKIVVEEDESQLKPNIWNTAQGSNDDANKEISPLNMSIAEFKKTTEDRKMHLKKHNYTFHQTPSNIDELEREPAFKRQNIVLEDSDSSSDSNKSRTSIELDENNEIQLRSNNSYLHDNVD